MKKRYVIEFTVEAEDYSDESIKNQALQELTCMVPFPEDIDFHRKDNPWHTGTPTEDGWYLAQVTYGYYFVLDINPLGKFMVDAFGERTELTKEDIECVVAYQKIEPRKED